MISAVMAASFIACPNGHADIRLNGTYTHINGKTQRYYCRICGLIFSFKQMNRIKTETRTSLERMLREGASIRTSARLCRVNLTTARSIANRIGAMRPSGGVAIEKTSDGSLLSPAITVYEKDGIQQCVIKLVRTCRRDLE